MRRVFVVALLSLLSLTACGVAAQSRPSNADSPYRKAADYSSETRGLSLIVYKDGKVVFEEYHNGHSADAPHLLASGTKSFVGVMLAAAIEDGLIKGFDERVSETLTEWRSDPRKSRITYRELLTLTGGLDSGPIGRPPSYAEAAGFDSKFEPGKTFEYGPVPFQVFGEALRRKLEPKKESVMDYMERRIFDPIGMKYARWTMQAGQPNLPSGASLTAGEWLKFGKLLLDGGKWNGKQVIKKGLLDELTKGSKANPNYGITFWLNRSGENNANVAENRGRLGRLLGDREANTTAISKRGFGDDLPRDIYVAAGAGNQRLYIIPSEKMVVVRQARQGRFDDGEFLRLLLGKK